MKPWELSSSLQELKRYLSTEALKSILSKDDLAKNDLEDVSISPRSVFLAFVVDVVILMILMLLMMLMSLMMMLLLLLFLLVVLEFCCC